MFFFLPRGSQRRQVRSRVSWQGCHRVAECPRREDSRAGGLGQKAWGGTPAVCRVEACSTLTGGRHLTPGARRHLLLCSAVFISLCISWCTSAVNPAPSQNPLGGRQRRTRFESEIIKTSQLLVPLRSLGGGGFMDREQVHDQDTVHSSRSPNFTSPQGRFKIKPHSQLFSLHPS